MLLVALAIRLDSPGPAVFLQKRVGKGGKNSTLYKFRSMYHAIDECKINPPAEEDDPRITRLGRFLRKSGWMNCHSSITSCAETCISSDRAPLFPIRNRIW